MRYLNLYSPSRWEPTLFDNFDRMFSDMLEPVRQTSPYEVSETENAFLLSIDAPGMKKEDVKIEVTGNTLTISGERRNKKSYGKFARSFTLPDSIDSSKIEANFEDGVLEIAIPKSEQAKPRTIEIQAGNNTGFFSRFLPKKETVDVKHDA
jgi:HSP20 family protein